MKYIPQPHRHGGRTGDKRIKLDLSVNLNPLGLPEGVRDLLEKGGDIFTDYPDPDCGLLRSELASVCGTGPEHIVCGNGASDLIYRIAAVFSGGRALIPVPAFSEYERALAFNGWDMEFIQTTEETDFALTAGIFREWAAGLKGRSRDDLPSAVFLCDPCNPSGKLLEPDLLEEVFSWCSDNGALLVVDECFLEFSDRHDELSMISYIRKQENISKQDSINRQEGQEASVEWKAKGPDIIVVRAFTKIYAMAGLRLGYCICSRPETAGLIMSAAPPWMVSGPAQAAGIQALKDRDYIKRTVTLVAAERACLREELESVGGGRLRIFDSGADYILFRGPRGLLEKMEENGIAIRDCSDYRGLENCRISGCEGGEGTTDMTYYRIGVRTGRENREFLQVLRRCMQWL